MIIFDDAIIKTKKNIHSLLKPWMFLNSDGRGQSLH